jgi:hypothetical protein
MLLSGIDAEVESDKQKLFSPWDIRRYKLERSAYKATCVSPSICYVTGRLTFDF